jgi:hypothetical protein
MRTGTLFWLTNIKINTKVDFKVNYAIKGLVRYYGIKFY